MTHGCIAVINLFSDEGKFVVNEPTSLFLADTLPFFVSATDVVASLAKAARPETESRERAPQEDDVCEELGAPCEEHAGGGEVRTSPPLCAYDTAHPLLREAGE